MTAPDRGASTAFPVVTVTPNPSLDHTVEVTVLERGEVQRTSRALVEAGGKGVNVARVLAKHGHAATAVLPAGADAQRLVSLLTPQQVDTVTVPITGAIRTNIAVVEQDGTTTKLNEPGADLTPAEVDALLAAVEQAIRSQLTGGGWLVAAGSLPAGAPDDLYARIARIADRAGVPLAVDTSGAALTAAITSGADVLKPNLEELEELTGRDLRTVADVTAAAAALREQGARDLLVSMGPHGALLLTEQGTWWAGGPALVPRSTVGAGDCTLSGYIHASRSGSDPADTLATAVAWGRAACLQPGSTVPSPEDTRRQRAEVQVVTDPDPSQSVKDG